MKIKNKNLIPFIAAGVAFCATQASAQGIFSPGDAIIAIDSDINFPSSSYPAGEAPGFIIDDDLGTKYLNFAGLGSGFIVTPSSGASTVKSFKLHTANDAEERDPSDWQLYGTNDSIASVDNGTGVGESWTLIGDGAVALPAARDTPGPLVAVTNSTAYTSYKMVFTGLKDPGAIMQVAEISMHGDTFGFGPDITAPGDAILALLDNPTPGFSSNYPGGEAPTKLIDGDHGSKYLNFGNTNSGFIITPASGPSTVASFDMVTGNDAPGRDPQDWIIYGTNDVIASADNSFGDDENWTEIDSGTTVLSDDRGVLSERVAIDNDTEYASYKMVFVGLKGGENEGIMQVGEVQFYPVPEPTSLALLGLGSIAMLKRRK